MCLSDFLCKSMTLHVNTLIKTCFYLSARVTVMEGEDAVLPCSLSSKENIEFKLFDWKKDGQQEVFMYDGGQHYNNGRTGQDPQFKGRVSHFEEELKHGNASITIRNTKCADSGSYTCEFPDLQPSRNIELMVGECFDETSSKDVWSFTDQTGSSVPDGLESSFPQVVRIKHLDESLSCPAAS